MSDKIKSLLKSRRFWAAVGGVIAVCLQDTVGLDETTTNSIVAVAVAWILDHPANIIPVMGTNNLDRITKISDALKVKMDRDTWFLLYTAALGRDMP